ncbi:MAG: single-stranded-DNA-specific exonuclease RecJ [Lachnospiraceae bacterium]|nr:single-stranded-DNA-specific exonuclease RecJ [Lachnospiraceae bacterium]
MSRKESWVTLAKRADFELIGKEFNIDPVIARLIRNRDVEDMADIRKYLNPDIKDLHDGYLMKDMEKGVILMLDKIKNQKKIRIIGDYDIDGVTSTYILYRGITALSGNVDAVIPDRVLDGYGLNINLINAAIEDGIDTIITCDNGISAAEEIRHAKENGLTVIVTDHHNQPYTVDDNDNKEYITVEADAVIDPKRIDCNYPYPGICGAMVAYKFIEKLLQESKIDEKEIDKLKENLIMYAAIGTVGDIMELKDENRAVVRKGLELIHKTDDISINALIKAAGISKERVDTYSIGFILGPCINASGRLETAKKALDLFINKNEETCNAYAEELVELNTQRKALTEEFAKKAYEIVETTEIGNDKVLVVSLFDCHESLAGIIAGRVKERYNKPTLVVTETQEGLKGSGRSIEAYNMFDEMSKVKELFTKFGGHALAAGFSLEKDKLSELRKKLNDNCTLRDDELCEVVRLDMAMPFEYVSSKLISEFALLEPFGQGNKKPLFGEKNLTIASCKTVGNERKFLKLDLRTENGNLFSCVCYDSPEAFKDFLMEKYDETIADDCISGRPTGIKITVCYIPEIKEYYGRTYLNMNIKNYKHA